MSLGAVAICSFTLVESPESVGLVSAQVDSKPIEDKGANTFLQLMSLILKDIYHMYAPLDPSPRLHNFN